MRIEMERDERGYAYRLNPDPDDRDAGLVEFADRPDREVLRVGDHYHVDLPGNVGDPHPDHHALAIWCAVRPYVGRRLELPFPVSTGFAARALKSLGVEFTRSSRAVEPWAPSADAPPALMFSGGTDSLAASLLMPPDTMHLVLGRITRFDRFDPAKTAGTVDQVDLRAVCDDVAATGRRVVIVSDDHEALSDPYPTWHTNIFVLPALYLARTLGLGVFDSGDVLDTAYIGGYHDGGVASWGFRGLPRDRTEDEARGSVTDFLTRPNPLALQRVESIRGLSAVATSAIVARSAMKGRAYSCSRPAVPNPYGRFCMQCDKCFMKLLLALVAEGRPVPAQLFDSFLAQPHLSAIFDRPYFDWHHLWFYLFQRMECDHPFARALRGQARDGPDLSFLERWYPRAADAIPQAYRASVVAQILDRVDPMTDAEVERLERMVLPPLRAPKGVVRKSGHAGAKSGGDAEASWEADDGWDMRITVVVADEDDRRYVFGIARCLSDGPVPFLRVGETALFYRGVMDGPWFEAAAALLRRVMGEFDRPPEATSAPRWRQAIEQAVRADAQAGALRWWIGLPPGQDASFGQSASEPLTPVETVGGPAVFSVVMLGLDTGIEASHVAINTTVRCQQRCVYCFEGDRAGKTDLPSETVREMLRESVGKVGGVMFMGAEPTLNPDLPELTRYARELGLWVGYSTNALRFKDGKFLRTCVDSGLGVIELSFCYPDADVYRQITTLPEAGFQTLLTALEQIESLNVERSTRGLPVLSVGVNCVVSLPNVERLDAVFGHLRARFKTTLWSLSLKRVGVGHLTPEVAARFHVPLGTLRRVFGQLPADLESAIGVETAYFRDFPLCALPGHEHREANVASLLENTRIQNNFGDQTEIWEMYPEAGRWQAHPFSWWCALCDLQASCVFRALFLPGGNEDARPVPWRDPPDAALRVRLGGDEVFRAIDGARERVAAAGRVDPGLVSLLAVLDDLAGRSPDGRDHWTPLETGVVRLQRANTLIRVGCGHPPADGTPFFVPANDLSVWLLEGGAVITDEARGMLDAFLQWVSETHRPVTGDAVAVSPWHAACRRVAEILTPAYGLGNTPSGLSFQMDPSRGAVPALVVRVRGLGGDDFAVRVDSPTFDGGRGFLCGRLRLRPEDPAVLSEAGRDALRRVAQALLFVQKDGLLPDRWPDTPPLLVAAWKRFGARLLPAPGVSAPLIDGEVLPDLVGLVFAEAGGRRVRVRLKLDPGTGAVTWHVEPAKENVVSE